MNLNIDYPAVIPDLILPEYSELLNNLLVGAAEESGHVEHGVADGSEVAALERAAVPHAHRRGHSPLLRAPPRRQDVRRHDPHFFRAILLLVVVVVVAARPRTPARRARPHRRHRGDAHRRGL